VPILKPTHRLEPTPNISLWALVVDIKQSVLVNEPEIIPVEGTLYKNISHKIISKDWLKKYGNYKLINTLRGSPAQPLNSRYPSNSETEHRGEMQDATVSLYFFPTLTDAQRQKPYRELSYFGDHRWPPILHSLVFFKDNTFPRFTSGGNRGRGAIISGPTYYVREVYTPECYEGSRFLQQEFVADVPYNIPLYPVPVPTSVSYDLPGLRGSFPECLHPKIVIPNTQTANAAFVAGDYSTASGAIQGQVFPATNFEDWAPYVLTDKQWFENGYRRTRIVVAPPGVDEFPFTIQ